MTPKQLRVAIEEQSAKPSVSDMKQILQFAIDEHGRKARDTGASMSDLKEMMRCSRVEGEAMQNVLAAVEAYVKVLRFVSGVRGVSWADGAVGDGR